MAEQVIEGAANPVAEKSFPPFDPSTFSEQLFWLVITFTALYFILSKIAIPRIGEVLEERHDRIQRDLDKAAELREETEKAIATYEEALADARKKAHAIVDQTKAKLNTEINAERAEIEEQIAKKTEQAEVSIKEAKEAAFAKVNEIAADTTGVIVEKLLGQKPADSDINSALPK